MVKNREKIKQLGEICPYADHITEGQAVFVVTSEDWRYWVEDASIIATHIWLETVNQGLSTCWTQVRSDTNNDREKKVRKILGLRTETRVLCLFPIGYPAENLEGHKGEIEKGKVKVID